MKGQIVDISGFLASRALLEPQLCPGGMEEPRVMCKHACTAVLPQNCQDRQRTGWGGGEEGESCAAAKMFPFLNQQDFPWTHARCWSWLATTTGSWLPTPTSPSATGTVQVLMANAAFNLGDSFQWLWFYMRRWKSCFFQLSNFPYSPHFCFSVRFSLLLLLLFS